MTPLEVAVTFVEAFGGRDMTSVARYVAEDIAFESPRVRIHGATGYLKAVGEFAQVVDGVTIIAALGDDVRAMVLYDMQTKPFGPLRAVDYLVIRGEKIQSHTLVFDTYEVRRAQGAA
jgi:hypothetical protein